VADIELSDAFFQKTAGWEAVQHARALLASGKVLSSNWTPPVLKGVVQGGETTYRSGLVIRGIADIDNLCTCRPSREDGILCAHSVAVGLHHLKRNAVETEAAAPTRTASPGSTAARVPAPVKSKDPVRLPRSASGEALAIHVILPPNLPDSLARGRAMLVFEGATARGRSPLNSLVRSGPFALSPADAALLDAAEHFGGGDTPGMVQLPAKDFLALLPRLAGHPRITVGRQQPLTVSTESAPLPLRATLESDGEITLALKPGFKVPTLIAEGDDAWVWIEGARLAPLALAAAFRDVLKRPMRLPRSQVPVFLSQDWPRLSAGGLLEANFDPTEFELSPRPPRFILNLAGGLAQLSGTLQCAYGPRIMTVGVTASGEAAWLPDPANPRRYSTRDLGAEHAAFMRLRAAGFSGPNSQGQWQLLGQDRVVAFFARDYSRLEREWEVALEERLERSTRNNLERITPQFRVTSGSTQWFDLEVSYASAGGERFSAADIQQLLRGGGSRKLKNGKFAILDTGAVEELQEVVLDCAPQQRPGENGIQYRMSAAQAGFLDASLQQQGFAVEAPPQWRDRVRQQTGEVTPACPPLGPLETVLRPYQKAGVAWIRFLRDHGFGGVLADEMGLGKTLQVLAHLQSLMAARLRGWTDSPKGPSPARPTLVICPTSLTFNWAAESARFTPDLRVLVLSGPDRHPLFDRIEQSDLVITSYALIRRDLERHRGVDYDTVILDEAQHIKNRQTQNAQAVKAIRSQHRLVLTGTPLENSVLDLWSILDFLMPGYLGTAQDFRERYEIPIVKERDTASMTRLARRIRPFLLRRLKRDVVKDLPAKLEQVSYCELTPEQGAVYQQLLAATRQEVLSAVGEQGLARSRMLVLTALLRLRQVCCDLRLLPGARPGSPPEPPDGETAVGVSVEDGSAIPADEDPSAPTRRRTARVPSGKLQMFGELLDEIVDGGHRALVFSQFTTMLGLLQEELEARELPFCYLDGSTSNREEVVRRFQTDASIPVFLISLKAGGVGLNLTGADTVVHFDPWWNPAVEDQATDRAHRIGQSRVVTSYKLITRGTVEEKILQLQRRKREIIESTLTGEEAFTGSLNWEEIQELLS
jgi:superfamily II DNA or RNA helicase